MFLKLQIDIGLLSFAKKMNNECRPTKFCHVIYNIPNGPVTPWRFSQRMPTFIREQIWIMNVGLLSFAMSYYMYCLAFGPTYWCNKRYTTSTTIITFLRERKWIMNVGLPPIHHGRYPLKSPFRCYPATVLLIHSNNEFSPKTEIKIY